MLIELIPNLRLDMFSKENILNQISPLNFSQKLKVFLKIYEETKQFYKCEEIIQLLKREEQDKIDFIVNEISIKTELNLLEGEALYWQIAAFDYKNKKNIATKYFSEKLYNLQEFENLIERQPPDIIGNKNSDEKYSKEKNEIPFDFDFRYNHYDYKVFTRFNKYLGNTILHLGCNLGLNSIILARNGKIVHGVDIQENAIKKALLIREKELPAIARRITYQASDFRNMILPENYFDTVFAFDVFEHIYESDLAQILENIKRALKDDGYFLIHVPFEKSFFDEAHVTLYNLEKINNTFGKYFEVVDSYITPEKNDHVNKRVTFIGKKAKNKKYVFTTKIKFTKNINNFESSFFNNFYLKEKAIAKLEELYDAVYQKKPFSMIRLGDVENYFLGVGKIEFDKSVSELEKLIFNHIGVDINKLDQQKINLLQNQFLNYCLNSNILGTHRHTVNLANHVNCKKVFDYYKLNDDYFENELDVVFNAEILDQGFLLPLLADKKILLIGNSSIKFGTLLKNKDYRKKYEFIGMPQQELFIADTIYVPHYKDLALRQIEQIWDEILLVDFDVALISASFVGKLLAGRIKDILGKVALDIGWSMQFLANYSSNVAPADDINYLKLRRGFKNLFKGRT